MTVKVFFSGLDSTTFRASALGLFVPAAAYAYTILTVDRVLWNAVTITFLAALLCVFAVNARGLLRCEEEELPGQLAPLLIYAAAIHLGLIAGFYLSGHPETALWAPDSYSRYVPGAVHVADSISGTGDNIATGAPFQKFFLTQTVVGVFFSFFGATPVASAAALMSFKLATVLFVFLLARHLFGLRAAALASLIYGFMPTVVFYTTVFYKEAAVQLITAGVLLSAAKLYGDRLDFKYWALLTAAMALLITERFYIFFLFLPVFVLLFLIVSRGKVKKYLLLLLPFIGAGIYLLLHKYAVWMSGRVIEYQALLPDMLAAIRDFRASYSQHQDVAAINYTLPYPLAFLKILFTPFFTLNKFTLFSDYSYILIWGSFANQVVIALSLCGMYRALKSGWSKHWFLITPYFLFLCVFAYVAPYSGRLRDSFYPLIAVYAAYAATEVYASARARRRPGAGARRRDT